MGTTAHSRRGTYWTQRLSMPGMTGGDTLFLAHGAD